MAVNAKIRSLSNDLVHSLLNTTLEYRASVVDDYGKKLLTSGYSYDQTVRILAGGAKGYLTKEG